MIIRLSQAKGVIITFLFADNPAKPPSTASRFTNLPPRAILLSIMGRRPYHNLSHHAHSAPRRDNPLYEFATATVPAPAPVVDEDNNPLPFPPSTTPAHDAAQMLRVVMSLIADACLSPLDAYYCVLRASGLSMEAIGRRDHNKTRTAVHKRLHKICRREPVLIDYLCGERRQEGRQERQERREQQANKPNKETPNA